MTKKFEAGMPTSLENERQRIDDAISNEIDALVKNGAEHKHPLIGRVYRWMRHYLNCGGKRMHGLAVILAYRACGGKDSEVVRVAAALQLYHHHTLVHDDIYDEDLARRGWPTTQVAFSEMFSQHLDDGQRRLFVNDALRRGTITAFAYGKICRAVAGRLILTSNFPAETRLHVANLLEDHDLYDNAAQLKDVYHEGAAMPASQACLDNAWLKTGRLFEICAGIGAALAYANESRAQAVRTWAGESALAYQLQDDMEDLATESEKGQGRGIATDLMYCKPTFLYAKAKELSTGADHEVLQRWANGEKHGVTISDISGILRRCGALDACRHEVHTCLKRARSALVGSQPSFSSEEMEKLMEFSEYFVSAAYWRRAITHKELDSTVLLQ